MNTRKERYIFVWMDSLSLAINVDGYSIKNGDDYYEPRFSNGSMSCLFLPSLLGIDGQPRKSVSYNKLPQEPLRLTILKLDGSSFGIEVAKMGTIGELKRAVEAAFRHLPKKGPRKISWEHVWGQFCLCHDGQKLLNDRDYIGMCGIKDNDQLRFIHHASNSCHLLKTRSKKEDSDSDDEPNSDAYKYGPQNDENDYIHCVDIFEDDKDADVELDDCVFSRCEHSLTHLLRGCCFPYRKFTSSHMRINQSSSSRFSSNILESFKNLLRLYSNKYDSRRETGKGK